MRICTSSSPPSEQVAEVQLPLWLEVREYRESADEQQRPPLKVARLLRLLALGFGALGFGLLVWTAVEALRWPDVASLATTRPSTTAFVDQYRAARDADPSRPPLGWNWTDTVSPFLARAVVCAEDMEFFSHTGFSTHEIGAAIREAIAEGSAPRGASTITQQLAKNLWLSPSRNPVRKLKEAILTSQLERHLTKERILHLYLNVVEFGTGIYGAEAAARHYFGKRAAALTPREASQLAASLPRPSSWNPSSTSSRYWTHVDRVWDRMHTARFLDRLIPGSSPVGR
jgi:monofunctional biosynthetic peptidoglycan transglycosylase